MHSQATVWAAWISVVLGAVGVLGLIRRYIVRPTRRGFAFLASVLQDVRAAAHSTEELFQLAGAVTNFAVATNRRLDDLERDSADREQRLRDLAELLTDALADLERLRLRIQEGDQS